MHNFDVNARGVSEGNEWTDRSVSSRSVAAIATSRKRRVIMSVVVGSSWLLDLIDVKTVPLLTMNGWRMDVGCVGAHPDFRGLAGSALVCRWIGAFGHKEGSTFSADA